MEKKEDRTREKREHKENGVLEGQERDMKKRVVQYQMSQSACTHTHTHTHAHAQTYTHSCARADTHRVFCKSVLMGEWGNAF